ncbi:MAG: hypothetical protein RJA35_449 [Actinomycetota bacterium]
MIGFLAYIAGVLVFLVGIGISIGLHEIGHLVPAKLFGARVSKYMIGFGPTLWSRKRGDTEYGIKLLPLGGYIAISGMLPPSKVAPEGLAPKRKGFFRDWVEQARAQQLDADGSYDESRAFYRLAVWRRVVIMLGGPVMNLILGSVLVLVALSGLGGYQASGKVAQVMPCVFQHYTQTTCEAADPESPAMLAGLKAGDTITAVDGVPVTVWSPVQQKLTDKPAGPLNLTVLRSGQKLHITLKPVVALRPIVDEVSGQVARNSNGSIRQANRGLIGVQLVSVRAPYAVGYSVSYIGYTLKQTAGLIADLPRQVGELAVTTFGGGKRSATGPVSVVGIGNISGSIAESNNLDLVGKISTWLMMLGSLNFALFVFNLVPLLPLDGGNVLNALWDGARRRAYKLFGKADPGPLDTAKFVPFTMFMWVLLMAMSALVIVADVVNPISLG